MNRVPMLSLLKHLMDEIVCDYANYPDMGGSFFSKQVNSS